MTGGLRRGQESRTPERDWNIFQFGIMAMVAFGVIVYLLVRFT